jgi:hypothetical protein
MSFGESVASQRTSIEFFPDEDPRQIIVYVEYPEGTDISKTNKIAKLIEADVNSIIYSDKYYDDTGYSGNGTIENPSRQFFIMGIRFLGYDEDGNIVNGETEFSELGGKLDESADGNAIFQVYYDLAITAVKFTIEGGATTYKFTGTALAPGKAFGIKRGRINSNKTIIGATFDGAMQGEKGLLTQINQIELEKKEKGEA